mmetsp:Transcript_8464/g.18446  ORF Transcript_8464/g.18446 Transcript_8464/m.18446 type:complete len:212 (-) Transcript_8464:2696-3331(-)
MLTSTYSTVLDSRAGETFAPAAGAHPFWAPLVTPELTALTALTALAVLAQWAVASPALGVPECASPGALAATKFRARLLPLAGGTSLPAPWGGLCPRVPAAGARPPRGVPASEPFPCGVLVAGTCSAGNSLGVRGVNGAGAGAVGSGPVDGVRIGARSRIGDCCGDGGRRNLCGEEAAWRNVGVEAAEDGAGCSSPLRGVCPPRPVSRRRS